MSTEHSMGGDAWEEDWESQADKLDAEPTPPRPEKKVSSKVTKAQRRAQQQEFNRQLWAEAESPQTFHFYEATSNVPLKQEFKPTVTVLSRNPQIAIRQSSSAVGAAAARLGRLDLNADDESDEENRAEPTPEERQAIALRNREEKQRKYEEVRERLFGTPSAPTSGASSPRSATPPRQDGRGKPRTRGNGRENNNNNNNNNNRDRRDQSTASSGMSRQLYDPGSPSKPNSSYAQHWDRPQSGERDQGDQPQSPHQPIRNPRGPDSSGRGGFRAHRGAKTS